MAETIKTSIVLESIPRSSLLVKLSLRNVVSREGCPLGDLLADTRTLLDLSYYCEGGPQMTYGVAKAIGTGFAQNKSLVKLRWDSSGGSAMVEVKLGLLDHAKIKTLELEITLTESSSRALRALLHCNATLERLDLTLRGEGEE
jgi:hypothetical protein